MGNLLYQQAREAITKAELLSLTAKTDEQRKALQKEVEKAQNSLLSAFSNSTPAEQEQLAAMQDHLQNLY